MFQEAPKQPESLAELEVEARGSLNRVEQILRKIDEMLAQPDRKAAEKMILAQHASDLLETLDEAKTSVEGWLKMMKKESGEA